MKNKITHEEILRGFDACYEENKKILLHNIQYYQNQLDELEAYHKKFQDEGVDQ